jgi:hypothetical protein
VDLIGVKVKKDGETTFYYHVEGSGGVEAGVPFGPGASGSAGGEGTVAVTVGADGKPKTLTLEGGATLGHDASWHADTDSLAAFVQSGLAASEDTSTRVWSATLDLTDPEARNAAADFLTSAGITVVAPDPNRVAQTVDAGGRIVDVMKRKGTITVVDYDGETSQYGAGADIGAGAKVGLDGGLGFSDRSVTGAQYWNGQRFVSWMECK